MLGRELPDSSLPESFFAFALAMGVTPVPTKRCRSETQDTQKALCLFISG